MIKLNKRQLETKHKIELIASQLGVDPNDRPFYLKRVFDYMKEFSNER